MLYFIIEYFRSSRTLFKNCTWLYKLTQKVVKKLSLSLSLSSVKAWKLKGELFIKTNISKSPVAFSLTCTLLWPEWWPPEPPSSFCLYQCLQNFHHNHHPRHLWASWRFFLFWYPQFRFRKGKACSTRCLELFCSVVHSWKSTLPTWTNKIETSRCTCSRRPFFPFTIHASKSYVHHGWWHHPREVSDSIPYVPSETK